MIFKKQQQQEKTREKILIFFLVIIFGGYLIYSNMDDVSQWFSGQLDIAGITANLEQNNPFDSPNGEDISEGFTQMFITEDFDEDGVYDVIELLLGSSINSTDTDSDGFFDYEEFVNGYYPDSDNAVVDEDLATKYQEFSGTVFEPGVNILRYYYMERAYGLIDRNEYDNATEVFKKAMQVEPNEQSYIDFVFTLYDDDRFADALSVSDQYVKDYPNSNKSYFHRGYGKQKIGQEGAEDDYIMAIDLGSTNPYANNNLGVIYEDQGQYEKAILYYNKAVEMNPKNPIFYNNISIVYEKMGEYDLATEFEEKALQLEKEM